MKDIKIGQYLKGDSYLHRLDPRAKIICCFGVMLSIFINFRWSMIIINLGLLIAAFISARIKLTKILQLLRKFRYLLILTFIFQAILTKGKPIYSLGIITITQEGVSLGASTICRLMILYFWSSLLTMTTTPIKLSSGAEALLSPLRYLGVPVHQIALVITTSLRFIPTIIEEAETITRAQASRGAPFNSPKLLVRAKSFTAVLIPLLAASLERAGDLAVAMESRCYSGGVNRIRTNNLCFSSQDVIAVGIAAIVVVSAFFIKV